MYPILPISTQGLHYPGQLYRKTGKQWRGILRRILSLSEEGLLYRRDSHDGKFLPSCKPPYPLIAYKITVFSILNCLDKLREDGLVQSPVDTHRFIII